MIISMLHEWISSWKDNSVVLSRTEAGGYHGFSQLKIPLGHVFLVYQNKLFYSMMHSFLEITSNPFDSFAVFHLGINGESGTLVHRIGQVCPGGLLKEVQFANDSSVVKVVIKWL